MYQIVKVVCQYQRAARSAQTHLEGLDVQPLHVYGSRNSPLRR